jgi:hypothetical protein
VAATRLVAVAEHCHHRALRDARHAKEPVPLGSTRGVEQLLALASRDGWRARVDAMLARGERLADA